MEGGHALCWLTEKEWFSMTNPMKQQLLSQRLRRCSSAILQCASLGDETTLHAHPTNACSISEDEISIGILCSTGQAILIQSIL